MLDLLSHLSPLQDQAHIIDVSACELFLYSKRFDNLYIVSLAVNGCFSFVACPHATGTYSRYEDSRIHLTPEHVDLKAPVHSLFQH